MEIEKGLISVIMTNYNTPEEYLREAIDSILNQTYSNFEFIIVDDCSSDDSLSVIESYHDTRIKVLRNTENIGLTKSLNKALNVAKGEFIARMDSDDISEPRRFQKQVDFLSEHEEVIVCGTWVNFIGDVSPDKKSMCRVIPNREIFRIMLLFGNYPNIVHPTAMFRHESLKKYSISYDERFIFAQDYCMWVSCSKYGECANVPEILFNYRIHQGAISSNKKKAQEECAIGIIRNQISDMGIEIQDEMMPYHRNMFSERKKYDLNLKTWIMELIKANEKAKMYNQIILEKLLWKKWAETVYFGLKGCSLKEKIKRLKTLPLKYYPELMKIFLKRRKG